MTRQRNKSKAKLIRILRQMMKVAEVQSLNYARKNKLSFDFGDGLEKTLRRVLLQIAGEAATASALSNRINFGGVEVGDVVEDIAEETFERIKTLFDELGEDVIQQVRLLSRNAPVGEVQEYVAEELKKKFATQYSAGKINRTAITETTRIYGQISKEIIEQAGFVPVWKHTGRGLVARPTHQAADGQRMNKERKKFYVGGEWIKYPGDGSKKNSINCHCIVVREEA